MPTRTAIRPWVVLSTNVVEVLALRVDLRHEQIETLARTLDPAEQRRARGLRGAAARRFVATRGTLRMLLGERLAVAASSVPLRVSRNGKLFALGGVLFSVSHSADLAVFAFTQGRRVGIDVERLRPVTHFADVLELSLAPSEVAELESVPAEGRTAAFFACWTRKEAYLKASGNRLGSPRDVAVSLRPGTPVRLVSVDGAPAEPDRWELTPFTPGPGYVGALAIETAA